MKRILLWIHSKIENKLRNKSITEILQDIDRYEKQNERTIVALDKALAALDGETGWWSCRCDPIEKECKYVNNNNHHS